MQDKAKNSEKLHPNFSQEPDHLFRHFFVNVSVAVRNIDWVQVPAPQIIEINSPNPLLMLDQSESCGSCLFIEIDPEKTIPREQNLPFEDESFGVEIDFFDKIMQGEGSDSATKLSKSPNLL